MSLGAALAALAVAALLAPAAAASSAASAPAPAGEAFVLPDPTTELPVVRFTRGKRLEELPGRALLMPEGRRTAINITLTPATLVAYNGSHGLQFTNGMYRDGDSGEVHLFGPTLRLKAGDTYVILLANNMSIGSNTTEGAFNEFRLPADTNLHTHGLHDSPGVKSQATATEYDGNDNIFITIEGKLDPMDEPNRERMNSSIPPDHLPGLHWLHPHMHGSSMLQTSTANALILVDDDESWLPAENGCAEVWGLMQEAPDVLLHLALLTFSAPSAAVVKLSPNALSAALTDTSYQIYSELVAPPNVYCCNQTEARSLPLLGTLSNSSFILVNGGLEPVISLQAGRYQRWRLAHTGYRSAVDLTILDPATGLPTDKCDLQLLAKDGVYPMQIPRRVGHIFLASGNRGEVLVRCRGAPGDRFRLASGAEPSPFGPGFYNVTEAVFTAQPVVATLELVAPEGPEQQEPAQKACTPLRPGYAPDLRDASLEAAGATEALINETVGFYFDSHYGCNVNGQQFSFPDPEPLLLPLGSVVHWHYEHVSSHPMHLHVNPYQIVDLPDEFLMENLTYSSWFEEGDYQDTIMLPSTKSPNKSTPAYVGLRIQPGQFAGYTVMHCHLLSHEDRGCMKMVRFECPGYEEEQPEICRNFTYPVPATYTKGRPFDWAPPSPPAAPAAPAPGSGAAGRALRGWLGGVVALLALAGSFAPLW